MVLAPEQFLVNLLQANGLRKFPDLGDLGQAGRRIRPKPQLERPQTVVLPPIRPASRRRIDTGMVAAGGHGAVFIA